MNKNGGGGRPVRSMTGYARVRRGIGDGAEVTVSLRGVNHRGLDLHFHQSADVEPFEPAMRKALTAGVGRGHIDVRVSLALAGARRVELNQPLLDAWLDAFQRARERHGLGAPPDLNAAFRMPDMLIEKGELSEADLESGVLDAFGACVAQFNAEREREGEATAAILRTYAESILSRAEQCEKIRGTVTVALDAKLRERMAELMGTLQPDPARIAQEAALLADRSDVGEELSRLKIHATELLDLLGAGGEVGKKAEFLAQEMQREANTLLAKSNSAGEPGRRLSGLALEVKSEIEKIREQSLNLE